MRLLRLRLSNFLSYRDATLELDDFTALVGANASGKSNAVAALKLLRDIPRYGLPGAVNRRGGFDQLRHRSRRPYDPGLTLEFQMRPDGRVSRYELRLGSLKGKRYEVKLERAEVATSRGAHESFTHRRGALDWEISGPGLWPGPPPGNNAIEPGQSAIQLGWPLASREVSQLLRSIQIVEIDPARVGDLQEPAPTHEMDPDGSNAASCFETLPPRIQRELVDELAAIVPGLTGISPRRFADRVTLVFSQMISGKTKTKQFLAKQMSDGTLRAFGILLAQLHRPGPTLTVIELPEIAIHGGAQRTLVEILEQHAEQSQVLITTHSADVIDALDIDALRVVWAEDGVSKIARVAEHPREPVRGGLITPGELLRSDALDPVAIA